MQIWLRLLLLAVILGAREGRAEIGDGAADHVIGQSSLDSAAGLALSAATFALPKGIAIDRSVTPNRAYVTDGLYHRVLGWSDVDALVDGQPADLVIGQADFTATGCNRRPWSSGVPGSASLESLCDPAGLGVGPSGRLYVADAGNCRVLAFDDPFGSDQVADQVIGQPDGTSSFCSGLSPSASNLFDPQGVATDAAGNLFVADTLNCRVLEYDAPASNDAVADRVYGQTDFAGRSCSTLYFPSSVALDATGTLWIGSSSRVYGIESPTSSDTLVDRTLGSQQCNDGGETASSTCGPIAVATDPAGRLFVGDAGNNRVLAFEAPLTVAQAARVFGQPSFGGNSDLFHDECNLGGPSASSLCLRRVQLLTLGGTFTEAAAVAADDAGRLYVADGLNHRVVRYDDPSASDAVADLILGHGSAADVRKPVFTIDDPVVARGQSFEIVVLDRTASRILVYASYGDYPDQPQGVIGQPDRASAGCNTGGISAATLCEPSAVTVDRDGNLWVADSGNNRVLEYAAPWFAYDTTTRQYEVRSEATAVHGQPDFTSSACGSGTSGLCNPSGLAVDLHLQLYVADSGNHRVVQNQNPLADRTFERVFGQPTLGGTACNADGLGATSLCDPRGLTIADDDTLWVADRGNHRVLGFVEADSGDAVADHVIGQASFTSNGAAAGPGGLSDPTGVTLDPAGNLFVADSGNNRVLEFDAPASGDTMADRVFGQADFAGTECNADGVSASSLCAPTSLVVESSYEVDRLYVADAGNHRVLRIDAPFCRADFTLTAANARDRTPRSKPKKATLKLKRGPGAADDVLSMKGELILLEQDGGVSAGDEPLLTLSNGGGIVYQERVPSMSNIKATTNGGVWGTRYLKDERDSGIDDFVVNEKFVIPGGFSDKPQYDRLAYKGRAVGLDLPALGAGSATWRYQYGSLCFTAEMACKAGSTSVSCKPAR